MRERAIDPCVGDVSRSSPRARPRTTAPNGHRLPTSRAGSALLAALVLAACSAGPQDAGGDRAGELDARVAALEERLTALEHRGTSPSPIEDGTEPDVDTSIDRADALDAAFDALAARVDGLAEEIGEEAAARTLAGSEASAVAEDLDQRLRAATAELDAVRAELDALKQRVDGIRR